MKYFLSILFQKATIKEKIRYIMWLYFNVENKKNSDISF